jgi:hypothetical protein
MTTTISCGLGSIPFDSFIIGFNTGLLIHISCFCFVLLLFCLLSCCFLLYLIYFLSSTSDFCPQMREFHTETLLNRAMNQENSNNLLRFHLPLLSLILCLESMNVLSWQCFLTFQKPENTNTDAN